MNLAGIVPKKESNELSFIQFTYIAKFHIVLGSLARNSRNYIFLNKKIKRNIKDKPLSNFQCVNNSIFIQKHNYFSISCFLVGTFLPQFSIEN